jgi:hypothetical protein
MKDYTDTYWKDAKGWYYVVGKRCEWSETRYLVDLYHSGSKFTSVPDQLIWHACIKKDNLVQVTRGEFELWMIK